MTVGVGDLRRVLRESRVLWEIGDEPTPGELADTLWIAMLTAPQQAPEATAEAPSLARPTSTSVDVAVTAPPGPVPVNPPSPASRGSPSPSKDLAEDDELHVRLPEPHVPDAPSAPSHTMVQATVSPLLLQPLPLARALRPLRRRLASGGPLLIDEDATADLGAEQRLWLPVLAAVGELAFDLALVIDTSDSMSLWNGLIREFRLLCEQLGAFRDVRTWHLTMGRADSRARPALRGASSSAPARDPRELLDPSGRRVIVVVTDGVHPWWRPTGPLRPILADWAAASPLAILQPFPQRLWDRSALRPALAEFHATGLGRHSARILRSPHLSGLAAEKLAAAPLLELTPTVLNRWARILAGSDSATPLAAVLLTGELDQRSADSYGQSPDSAATSWPDDPGQHVRAFRAWASAAAYTLAGYLSVVAPLRLPVMRLVQESMLPSAGPAELAEVFLGGLLRRLPDSTAAEDPEYVTYAFAAGIRDVLQSTITRTEAAELLDRIGSYLVRGSGPAAPSRQSCQVRRPMTWPRSPRSIQPSDGSRPRYSKGSAALTRRLRAGSCPSRHLLPGKAGSSPERRFPGTGFISRCCSSVLAGSAVTSVRNLNGVCANPSAGRKATISA